jgi:hypothetical protein
VQRNRVSLVFHSVLSEIRQVHCRLGGIGLALRLRSAFHPNAYRLVPCWTHSFLKNRDLLRDNDSTGKSNGRLLTGYRQYPTK